MNGKKKTLAMHKYGDVLFEESSVPAALTLQMPVKTAGLNANAEISVILPAQQTWNLFCENFECALHISNKRKKKQENRKEYLA